MMTADKRRAAVVPHAMMSGSRRDPIQARSRPSSRSSRFFSRRSRQLVDAAAFQPGDHRIKVAVFAAQLVQAAEQGVAVGEHGGGEP